VNEALRRLAIGLAVVGLGVASYLTYIHYRGIESVCAIAHGCEQVQTSEWSKLLGVPVALLGLIGYVSLLGALIVDGEAGRLAAVTFAWTGAAFSAYLTYREIFTIDAICIWCVISAFLMADLTVLTTIRFLRAPQARGPAGPPAAAA
jgi:uncharacterized membrane protein